MESEIDHNLPAENLTLFEKLI